jgi:hypothetical protein
MEKKRGQNFEMMNSEDMRVLWMWVLVTFGRETVKQRIVWIE